MHTRARDIPTAIAIVTVATIICIIGCTMALIVTIGGANQADFTEVTAIRNREMVRFWLRGPRLGPIRPGVSFSAAELGFGKQPQQKGKAKSVGEKLDGSFIYVIRGSHMCKIGVSTNPTARLATLRTSSPFPLSFAFIGATNGTNGFAIEQEAHRLLERHRTEGEWFDIPEELAIATVWAAAASLGEKLAFVDPSRVDDVIKACTIGNDRQPVQYGNASYSIGNSGAGGSGMGYAGMSGMPEPGPSVGWFRRLLGYTILVSLILFIVFLFYLGSIAQSPS